jgi:hypothetical protein
LHTEHFECLPGARSQKEMIFESAAIATRRSHYSFEGGIHA